MIERPLFPRYLFIGFTAAPPWLEVGIIEGIAGIIRANGTPLKIHGGIIGQLRERIVAGEFAVRKPPTILSGMTVLITDGPMRGMQGICASVIGDTRADLLIALLGQMVNVKIAVDELVVVA